MMIPAETIAKSIGGPSDDGLVSDGLLSGYNNTQQIAAVGLQAIYNDLVKKNRTVEEQRVFNAIAPLVENANEINGSGSTELSLGVAQSELNSALQWTSFEEVSGQRALVTELANTVSSTLSARLSALRQGASGFSVAGTYETQTIPARGGNAGESLGDTASPWGGFIRLDGVEGSRVATTNEDGYHFEYRAITVGADYRLSDVTSVGAAFTYNYDQNVEFDSTASPVDASISADGWGVSFYGVHSLSDQWFIEGLASYNRTSFDMRRKVIIKSNNLSVPSVNEDIFSNTSASSINLVVATGYDFNVGESFITPSLQLGYQNIHIDAYTESGNSDYRLSIDKQKVNSLLSVASVDVGTNASTSFGVLVPTITLSWFHEFETAPTTISARFAGTNLGFNVQTDELDGDYFGAGFSLQLLHYVGVQAFLRYDTILGHRYLDDYDAYSLGLRYEF